MFDALSWKEVRQLSFELAGFIDSKKVMADIAVMAMVDVIVKVFQTQGLTAIQALDGIIDLVKAIREAEINKEDTGL